MYLFVVLCLYIFGLIGVCVHTCVETGRQGERWACTGIRRYRPTRTHMCTHMHVHAQTALRANPTRPFLRIGLWKCYRFICVRVHRVQYLIRFGWFCGPVLNVVSSIWLNSARRILHKPFWDGKPIVVHFGVVPGGGVTFLVELRCVLQGGFCRTRLAPVGKCLCLSDSFRLFLRSSFIRTVHRPPRGRSKFARRGSWTDAAEEIFKKQV